MTRNQKTLTWMGIALVAAMSLCACRKGGSASEAGGAGSTPGQTQAANVKARRDNPCSVLLPQEVEQIVGVPVSMREILDEETCSFPFEKPLKGSSQAPKSVQGGKQGAHSEKEDAEAMAKTLAAGMVGTEPRLVVKVYWEDGRQAITATRMAGNLLGGNDSGFEKLSGIGDEAWLGPMASNLTFVKGKTGVEIDLRMIPNGREPGIRLARLIASRL
jgi:hypothetical protein